MAKKSVQALAHKHLTVASLFTGAGGFDLGLEEAGFRVCLCVESDPDARRTIGRNRRGWNLADPPDIHALTPNSLLEQAGLRPRQLTLLAGGPPCQPFSKSAYWVNGDSRRLEDPRARTLDAFLRTVDAALPRIVLLENVGGIAFAEKDEGLRFINSQLREINRRRKTSYQPQVLRINAADYGVPQLRERVFLIATRHGGVFSLPASTHGPGLEPHRTAWDAIGDLDVNTWSRELEPTGRWADLLPSIPEGRNYLWHTPRNEAKGGRPLFGWRTRYWSFLLKLAKDQPAWTIQASPGPATGPFHWKGRLLSVEELCRLQTFPEGYKIEGNRRSAQRQIGNAVPSAIGEFLGLEIRRQFLGHRVRHHLRLIPSRREGCPPPERPAPVPERYETHGRTLRDHPGTGLGPGARPQAQDRAIR